MGSCLYLNIEHKSAEKLLKNEVEVRNVKLEVLIREVGKFAYGTEVAWRF
ncbi:MAG: hypothetical protein ACI9V1_000577 [Spirosomataceae bacterium]|jgi:hypothetical protein